MKNHQPYSPKLPPLNPIPPHKRKNKSDWEEEFEDEIRIENYEDCCREDVTLTGNDLVGLIRKYLFLGKWCRFRQKAKIKLRKGCVQIERV